MNTHPFGNPDQALIHANAVITVMQMVTAA